MNWWEILACLVLAIFALEQVVGVRNYLVYCRSPQASFSDGQWPPATVIISLRGADPLLSHCLAGLFDQDYPQYDVRVVVDNTADAAWEVAQQAVQTSGATNVEIMPLAAPAQTCSLKCSALAQATADLTSLGQVVAFLDADVVPHRTWLRELVGPLVDESIGAATGNRWYAPREGHFGSEVRYLWNVVAVVTMWFWKFPWGGSLAFRSSLLPRLREMWLNAGCDDGALIPLLQKLRLPVKSVPSLLMVNREDSELRACYRFVTRQMLWMRLYYPLCWWVSYVRCLLLSAGMIAAVILAAIAAYDGRWLAFTLLAGSILFFVLVSGIVIGAMERHVARTLATLDYQPRRLTLKTLISIPLAQLMSAVAMLQAFVVRRIRWRGIDYRIRGPWKVEMLQYRLMATGHKGVDAEV